MTDKADNYNLLVKPWIPILWTHGKPDRVSIRTALVKAGRIRQIAASNPMDNVALLRLLLAVLQWCKPGLTGEDCDRLKSAGGIPDDWVEEKLGAEGHPNAAFDLLGAGARFYQDQTQSRERPNRPVSDLFAYLPADTEINHFRHVYDRTIVLCPACCALGLVRLSASAMQGGQGKSPSINNAPPIYFLPVGKSLLETLHLNWPFQHAAGGDRPAWETGKRPAEKIGVLEGFTWQPRAVWLGLLVEDAGKMCTRCGEGGPLVSKLVFKKGRSWKVDARAWRDPHVAWAATENRADDEGSGVKDRALRGPDPLRRSTREAALWRQTARAVLESAGKDAPIPSVGNLMARRPQRSDLRVTCFEPFTKQAKAFDEHQDGWDIPLDILRNDDLRKRALEEIRRLEGLDPSKVLSARSPRSRDSAGAIIAADTQHRLRERFKRFLNELARADTDEKAEGCVKRWRGDIAVTFREVVDRACSFTTAGSPLRRLEAAQEARQKLYRAMEKLANSAKQAPAPEAAGNPNKGGGSEARHDSD